MTPSDSPSFPFQGEPLAYCLVIPAFHESQRIAPFLQKLLPLLESETLKSKVIVVDDGSGKTEQDRLRAVLAPLLSRHYSLQLLELPENRGKGGAVKAGWDSCPGCEYLAFADADGSVGAREMTRLSRLAWDRRAGQVTLFASRIKMLGRDVERRAFRHYSGRIFATLVSLISGIEVYDSQCGAKFVPSAVYRTIRPVLRESGFAFDVELMMAILRSGHAIEEVPVNWRHTSGSKVSFFRDTFRMVSAVVAIRQRTSTWKFSK